MNKLSDPINTDTTQSVVMYPEKMAWQTSPTSSVSRKRFYLDGLAESGKVTSLVRYVSGAQFPAHEHPDGEEILVLEGVFSDATGDYSAGSYLLNPEGFVHAPFSKPGCLLFVKLRQYQGQEHLAINLNENYHERRVLCATANSTTYIVNLDKNSLVQIDNQHGLEGFVISGCVSLDKGIRAQETLKQFNWFRLAPGERCLIESQGARLYLMEGRATVQTPVNTGFKHVGI